MTGKKCHIAAFFKINTYNCMDCGYAIDALTQPLTAVIAPLALVALAVVLVL